MSHHLSGPNLRSPAGDARLDLTDLFAFPAPGGYRTVLIMDINPDFGGFADAFHPDAVYRINVDTDADHRADVAFSMVFSEPADGAQSFTVYRATGDAARTHQATGEAIIVDAPVSFGAEPRVVQAGPYRGFAGRRSDPFFADLDGILDQFQWTGLDTMADKDVLAIALELPITDLGAAPAIGVWARVSLSRHGELVSVDRGGHPSLTAFFNPEEAKDAYNAGEPADDWDTYAKGWTAVLEHAGGYSVEDAEQVLHTVLPDILRYDRDHPAAYPNGRTLTDDVLDARLAMVTNGKIAGDHIGPHTDLLPDFPYLGHPHR
jgi:hypothetical protein